MFVKQIGLLVRAADRSSLYRSCHFTVLLPLIDEAYNSTSRCLSYDEIQSSETVLVLLFRLSPLNTRWLETQRHRPTQENRVRWGRGEGMNRKGSARTGGTSSCVGFSVGRLTYIVMVQTLNHAQSITTQQY